ncbi:MAG: ABC-2 transporter permease [Candidatus Metalachnospira sp.]|nr:ABC-2 transporter permease [Candidatus Metalachnospira sp.]
MKQLLIKELRLSMHPTALIFLLLSVMLVIPNYPYYVVFFYTGLAVFFTCLLGRENHDIEYMLIMPIRKCDAVKARFAFVVLQELIQMIIAVPFALIRQHMPVPPNAVGMDANIALFGSSLVMMGLFNLVFFGIYYKNPQNVGKAFGVSSIIVFVYMTVAEALVHIVPFVRDKLDTSDTMFLGEKLIVLVIGMIVFALTTAAAYKRAVKSFETLDI